MSTDPARVDVVVGATGAVGSALVARLLARGRRVVAVARTVDHLPADAGLVACAADLRRDDAVEALRDTVDAAVGLVAFAPGLAVSGSFAEIDATSLTAGFDLKVSGMVRLLRAVDDRLADGSRVVAVAGSLGVEPGPLDAGPGTVNAALLNLMRQVSLQLGPRGVTTVTVAPGPLDTPRLAALVARQAQERGVTEDEVRAEYLAKTSSGRLPSADEVAWLIETLLAQEARILHGSVLSPDGGVRHGLL